MKTQAYAMPSATREIIQGNWDVIKGKLKQQYGRLTDNDLTYVKGKEEELVGRLEKAMGQERKEIERFIKSCGC